MDQNRQTTKLEAPAGSALGLHRFLLFLSLATVFLIVAGALVTSNDAGLSVPDWPTSFGSFRMPPMVGGVFYEHGHRMVAATVGFLTIVLTGWIFWLERRGWIRKLALAALLAVILQAVLGGITVLHFLPPPISTFHACLAQLFFCMIVSLAVFTSPSWNGAAWKLEDPRGIPVRVLCSVSVCVILLQLFLGAAFRHRWFNLVPHMVGAALVTLTVLWTILAVQRRFRDQPFLTRPAWVSMGLLVAQLILGPSAYFLMVANASEPQPLEPMIGITVAHVVVGALTLATVLVLTLRVFRIVVPRRSTVEEATWAHGASSSV